MHARHVRLRLHHRWCGVRRLRTGRPADRKRPSPCAVTGSRWQRPPALGTDAHRLWQGLLRQAGQLDVPDRAGPGPGRAQKLLAARQGAGGLQFDQRHGLCPGAGDGFRPLGGGGQPGLGLGVGAALFPQVRALRPGRQRPPWGRWSTSRGRRVHPGPSSVRRVSGGGPAGGFAVYRGLQRRQPSRA